MKYLPTVAGIVLGLLFVLSASVVLFNLLPPDKMPKPPTPEAEMFMGAFAPTGYLTFVKVCEFIGGILVAIPLTRNIGLLFLGPIILNILAYHAFVTKGADLFSPMIIVIVLLTIYLLWTERRAFAGLVARRTDGVAT